jgi:uncharacterized phage protein (TIGR02218 family)
LPFNPMYDTYETSQASAAPVELYEFVLGSEVWRQTSADVDVTYGGHTWTATPLSRGEIEEGTEINRANLELNCAIDNPVAGLYLVQPPDAVVLFRLRRLHRGDSEALVIWLGRVLNCEWSGREAKLFCEPVFTSIRQPGLRRLYSRLCTHTLYEQSTCRVNPDDFDATATLATVDGVAISFSSLPVTTDGYWQHGRLRWIDGDGRAHWRMIETQAGLNATLVAPIPGLSAGQTVTVWPGCDKTLKTCRLTFNNRPNFGGFKWIPDQNPFSGQLF